MTRYGRREFSSQRPRNRGRMQYRYRDSNYVAGFAAVRISLCNAGLEPLETVRNRCLRCTPFLSRSYETTGIAPR
jgi:hypothetical protein